MTRKTCSLMPNNLSASLLFLFTLGILLTIGCGGGNGFQRPPLSVETPAPAVMLCAPVRIAFLQDQTESTTWTRTPQVKFEDLLPMIDLCSCCGGELAFGLIRDRSNRSLVRLRLDAAPQEPEAGALPRNRFKAAQVKANDDKKREEYENQLAEWQAEAEARIAEFRSAIEPLLAANPDAGRTDLNSAIVRADAFLAEDEATWGQKTHRWAIFVSDGQDNVHAPVVTMRSQAKVLVVNGSASLGVIERLNPVRFEAPTAAFDFIVSTESRKP